MDHVHAAAVPRAGLTAWQALFDHGRLARGQTVVIHRAGGAVGSTVGQAGLVLDTIGGEVLARSPPAGSSSNADSLPVFRHRC